MLTINDLSQIQELIDFALKKAFITHNKEAHEIELKRKIEDTAQQIKGLKNIIN